MTHDRFGEQLDNSTQQPHDPHCRRGWLGEDIDGRQVPCIICRPHLFRTKVHR